MDNKIVRFTVDFAINEGKFDQFESIAKTMIAGTLKEAGALGYEWFLSADRKRCRLLEAYKDQDAVLAHCIGPVAQQLVPKCSGFRASAVLKCTVTPVRRPRRSWRELVWRSSGCGTAWADDPVRRLTTFLDPTYRHSSVTFALVTCPLRYFNVLSMALVHFPPCVAKPFAAL